MAIIAFRADEQLEERLRRAAREEKKTRTAVIREALDLYLRQRSNVSQVKQSRKRASLAEALKTDIGVWDGPEDSSVSTSRQFREILGEKHRTRRV